MIETEQKKGKNKPQSVNKKVRKPSSVKKQESSYEYNFFDYLYEDKETENNKKSKKDENSKEYINPQLVIERLKKEQEDTKILLKKLSSHKKVNKDFVKEMEKEKAIKKRYNTRKNLIKNRNDDMHKMKQNIMRDEKNIKRTNKM